MGQEALAVAPRLSPVSVSTASGPAKPATSLYFINAWADFGIIGGISIAAYLVMLTATSAGLMTADSRPYGVYSLVAMLAWICNWPHFSATNYRLYHSVDNIKQYPLTAIAIPPLLVLLGLASLISPTGVAPYLVKLMFLWSPYHFSGQSLGVTLIYARRSNVKVGRWERLGLASFIYGTFMVLTSRAEAYVSSTKYYGIDFPGLGVPIWLSEVFEVVMWGGGVLFLTLVLRPRWYEALACCAVTAEAVCLARPDLISAGVSSEAASAFLAESLSLILLVLPWLTGSLAVLALMRLALRRGRSVHPIILVPAAAQCVWFVLGSRWQILVEFVPFFHCLQYLLIAWSMQLKEKLDLRTTHPEQSTATIRTSRDIPAQIAAAALLLGLAFLASRSSLATQVVLGLILMLGLLAGWLRGWFLAVGAVLLCILPAVLARFQGTEKVQPWEYFLTMTVPIALLFAWAMQRQENRDQELIHPSKTYVAWESLRWGLVNFAGGAMLFFILPSLVARVFNLERNFAMGVTIATVQIHHFFVDGVIWKLKRKTVSSPLMVNLGDLLGKASPAMAPA